MAVKSNSQPAPQRQVVLTFATPSVADILFYETVDGQRIGTAVPDYGTPHPDSRRWPNHKLVFIQNDDEAGQMLRYYYAADRDAQDAYNYELTEGAGVTRTYVIPRADYPAKLPVPAGGTPDTAFPLYGFVSDSIVDVGQPLNGLYIAVQRKFTPITKTEVLYDEVIEANKTTTVTLKPFGFQLAPVTEPPTVPLVSGNGTVYEVKYVNQFHSVLIKSDAGVGYSLQRKPVLDFVSPSIADILFYETVSSETALPTAYGSPYPTAPYNTTHKLVYIDTEESGKGHLQRRYYAADRVSQEVYNYELTEGISLTRTYVIKRADYNKSPAVAGSTTVTGTLATPAGGTPDTAFPSYGFVSDSIVDVGKPLNGLYIVVQRKFEPITKIERLYDPVTESDKTVTTTIKPFGYVLNTNPTQPPAPAPPILPEVSGNGTVYEVKYVNQFHSVLIKSDAGVGYPLQRKPVLDFVSPSIADILFYETVSSSTPLPTGGYGSAYPTAPYNTTHKLVYVDTDESGKGHLQRRYYAADRLSQEVYNYELTEGVSLTRTYVVPRVKYNATTEGAFTIPGGGTPDTAFPSYGFVSDSIVDIGKPLNGLYIVVQRKFEPITKIERLYDPVTESDKTVTTTIKPFGYVLNTNPTQPPAPAPPILPEVSGNGTVYEVKYVNQFHSVLIKSDAGVGYPLQRKPVLDFVSPSIADILFYETVSSATPLPTGGYGTAYGSAFPNHKLVYIDTEDSGKGHLQRRYYAADRVSQEAYNYELTEGISLTRTYVIKRADYNKTPAVAGSSTVTGTLAVPAGGTPDTDFSSYGFVSDSIVDVGKPLNGLYIVIQRKFEPITKTDLQYDQSLEGNIITTTTLKPFGYTLVTTQPAPPPAPQITLEVSGSGVVYEVKYVNAYHSLLVKTEIGFSLGSYKALDTVYSMTMYKLPSVLTGFTVYNIYAFMRTSTDYSESVDFMGVPTIVEMSDGPYKVTTSRYLTSDPNNVLSLYTSYPRLPVPPEDVLVAALYGAAWFTSSGSATSIVQAREFPVPRALIATSTVGQSGPANVTIQHNLSAQISGASALAGNWLIDVSTKEVALNLYEVSASVITITL